MGEKGCFRFRRNGTSQFPYLINPPINIHLRVAANPLRGRIGCVFARLGLAPRAIRCGVNQGAHFVREWGGYPVMRFLRRGLGLSGFRASRFSPRPILDAGDPSGRGSCSSASWTRSNLQFLREGGICPHEPCPSGYSLRGTPGSALHPGVGLPIQGCGFCGAARSFRTPVRRALPRYTLGAPRRFKSPLRHHKKRKKGAPICSGLPLWFHLVPMGGFEPPRGCPHQTLNLARLPVPPLRHAYRGSRRVTQNRPSRQSPISDP